MSFESLLICNFACQPCMGLFGNHEKQVLVTTIVSFDPFAGL